VRPAEQLDLALLAADEALEGLAVERAEEEDEPAMPPVEN
jgi:hypothetical protein